MRKTVLIACSVALALNAEIFELGQVEVVSKLEGGSQKSDANVVIIDGEQMRKNQVKRLSEVAYMTPGVYVDKKGPRAEQNFYVRGFDARRVPLFIDGIPVYNPYDGNSDFGRFTTFDLSHIDISKGSSSVLYGANTMGGAINLVSKKPVKDFEGDVGYGIEFGRSGKTFGNNVDFSVGSRQELVYAQAGGSFMEDKGQQLSNDFVKDAKGNEDGDRRQNSVQRDKKINLRLGLTPNETDEYAVTYVNQKGEKEQPAYAGRYPKYNQANRFWDWPIWDKQSVYWLSHTEFDKLYVNTKAFYDTYKNNLNSYTDKTYAKKTFSSHYKDYSYGFGVEIGGDIGDNNTLKFASGYKFDEHQENDDGEPVQTYQDKTYTFGLENTYKFSDMTRFILGVSYDTRDAIKAQEYGQPLSGGKKRLFDFEVGERHALNYQAAIKHSFDGNDELSLSYAKKTYFPSMKERYSERFGRNTPNPFLKPEVANHYEIGYARNFGDALRVESSIFYSKVKDAIGDVMLANKTRQAQNIDRSEYKGFELGATFVTDKLELGGNYTYINAKYKSKSEKIYDLPRHKAFAYADFKILPKFSVYASQELVSSRYSDSYEDTRLNGFGVTHLKFIYKPVENLSFDVGISNLFDKNYEYREGYPEEGRVFFSNVRYKF